MIYVILRKDKTGADEMRDTLKMEHRKFLASLGKNLVSAGALFNNEAKVIGGMIVVQAESLQAAWKIANQDPYARHPNIMATGEVLAFRMRWKDGQFIDGEGYRP